MSKVAFWAVLILGLTSIIAGFATRIVFLVLIGLAIFVIRVIPHDRERDQREREERNF